MLSNNIKLETKLVGDIEGTFFVPSYQRGYRWGQDEVTRLLDDIYSNGNKSYCLQPVVVRKKGEVYELIDGQQRLTTLYILLMYIQKEYKPKIQIKFTLEYETRKGSASFLANINSSLAEANIDYFHIYGANCFINNWFNNQKDSVLAADEIYGYLVKYVKVIWYEVDGDKDEDAISLFTRLNIGKIPLTNAELVKAMFLASKSKDEVRQGEIALQWDNIERELHDEAFWFFLTNDLKNQYQTRIDLILDIKAEKSDIHNNYNTFYKFVEMSSKKALEDIWSDIYHAFLTLKDWYENHEYYHKIGYLIASESKTLLEIYNEYEDKKKTEFKSTLNTWIIESVSLNNDGENSLDYTSLSYLKDSDIIKKILLLFNVESVRQSDNGSNRFSFDKFKKTNNNASWSLEHIHAQQSQGFKRDVKIWKTWVNAHLQSLERIKSQSSLIVDDDIIHKMQNFVVKDNATEEEFKDIQNKVLELFSDKYGQEYNMHSIANLALINTAHNAALNNSTFDVKRDIIIDMDRKGQYIPLCTKRVFLKYYTQSESNQIFFWSEADRKAYVKEISKVFKDGYNVEITFRSDIK